MHQISNTISLARRLAAVSVFSLALLPLAAHAVVPTGGKVSAGAATFSTLPTGDTVVNQSSSRAIISWTSFSLDAGSKIYFSNGSGATLNRVTGGSASQIDGGIYASGSVYLINPNGIVIGQTGLISVGGSFVASAKDISNAGFMAGGDLTFSGPSTAAVVNLGQIGASGGDVVLIATTVDNEGQMLSGRGAVGLLGGGVVLIRDKLLDAGKFTVQSGTSTVTNRGQLYGAQVELRAAGGNIYALAGNTGGSNIYASGSATLDGKIFLVADAGIQLDGLATSSRSINASTKGRLTQSSNPNIAYAHSGGVTITAGSMSLGLIDAQGGDITLNSTAGGIDFQSGVLTTGHLVTNSAGTISEGSGGFLRAYSLMGRSVGGTTLNATDIHSLWAFTNTGAGGFTLGDQQDIHQSGTLNAGSGALSLVTGGNLYLQGNLTTSNQVTLYAVGTIAQQDPSVITAAGLSGAGTGGVMLTGANRVGTLSSFASFGTGNLYFNNVLTSGLIVNGPVGAEAGSVQLTSAGSMTLNGSVAAGQSSKNMVYLSAHGAINQTGGSVSGYALAGDSIGGAVLPSLDVHSLWGWLNTGAGPVTLQNLGDLHVTGAINAGTGALTLGSGAELFLQASLNAGASTTLTAVLDIQQTAGQITTGTLNANAGTFINLGQHNAISHLGVMHSGTNSITVN